MQRDLLNIRNTLQKKIWSFKDDKSYDWYIGKDAYICTVWDDENKINIRNYGKITFITDSFISFQSGKVRNHNNLPRNCFYSHAEIKFVYIRKQNSVDIKKKYAEIKKTDLKKEDLNVLHNNLIIDNFISI